MLHVPSWPSLVYIIHILHHGVTFDTELGSYVSLCGIFLVKIRGIKCWTQEHYCLQYVTAVTWIVSGCYSIHNEHKYPYGVLFVCMPLLHVRLRENMKVLTFHLPFMLV
jgi:hypothetical protein